MESILERFFSFAWLTTTFWEIKNWEKYSEMYTRTWVLLLVK